MGSSSSSTAAAAAVGGERGPNSNNGSNSNAYNQHAYHQHHHQQQHAFQQQTQQQTQQQQQQQYYANRAEFRGDAARYFVEDYAGCYGDRGFTPGSSSTQMQSSGSNRDLFQNASSQPSAKHEKKKKWWKRRSSRSSDPGQPLRELLANWSLGEVVALVHEYETMTNEKELYIHAESARPRAPTLRSDLADLLDFKWNSDVNLVLPPAIFPAHRAILSQRSKYFRNLLNSSNVSNVAAASVSNNGIVNVNVEDTSVDIPTFSSLLRYLYTEEVPSNSSSSGSSNDQRDHHQVSCGTSSSGRSESYHGLGTIIRPSKPLESDLRDLLQTGKYSDIVLVLGDEQFAVHKPILASRSPFFRSLLQRRSNSKKIVLDDTVIPKRYARVILNCMYTDKLDLSLIEPSRSGLTEVESLTFTGKVNPSGFEEAMELYQIGRFLEFDHLCVSSEDIITESLTHDSLPQILRWSSQSHGSSWVRRQAIMYVQEEYASLISNASFLELDKSTLLEVVQSDFLQASEVEVLNSIVKWGEHQLIKRVEDREPNLVSSTRDSVFRNERGKDRGKRGRNDKVHAYASDMHLNDGELREIVFELIRCVRVDHIGLSNEFLVTAVRRGLVSIPPTHMITEEKVNPWVNNLQCPNYIRPRLYTPYYEEAKSALRQRTGNTPQGANSNDCPGMYTSASSNLAYLNSIGRIKTLRPIIPDTLYMIDNSDGSGAVGESRANLDARVTGVGGCQDKYHHHHHHHHHHHNHRFEQQHEIDSATTQRANDQEDEVAKEDAKVDELSEHVDEMVVDQELLNAMLYREKKLRLAHLRNVSNPISRERATRYIRLRVVREFGYPDYVAELLDHHNRASLNNANPTTTGGGTTSGGVSTTTTATTSSTSTTSTSTGTTMSGVAKHDTKPEATTPATSSCSKRDQQQHKQSLLLHQPDCTSTKLSSSTSSTTYHHAHHHQHHVTPSPIHSVSAYTGPPPPPEFHTTNMPDVALNTTTTTTTPAESQQQQQQQLHPTHHQVTAESVLIPFLDLDLGDSNNGLLGPPERTSLLRSRNRSFGSLSGRGSSGMVCSSTQSLASRIGSSSNVAGAGTQQQQHHHHHTNAPLLSSSSSNTSQQFLNAQPPQPSSSTSTSGNASSGLVVPTYAAAQQPQHHVHYATPHQHQPRTMYTSSLQYAQVYHSIYSTTRPSSSSAHSPHPSSSSSLLLPPSSYPICSTSYSHSLQRIHPHQQQQHHHHHVVGSSSQNENVSLHPAHAHHHHHQQHAHHHHTTTPQQQQQQQNPQQHSSSTLLRSSIQIKNSNHTPPSHYL